MTNEERQQAIEWLKRRPVMMAGAKRMYDLAAEALEQPEIIHCKDCVHWSKNTGICHAWSLTYVARPTDENGFCYRAER